MEPENALYFHDFAESCRLFADLQGQGIPSLWEHYDSRGQERYVVRWWPHGDRVVIRGKEPCHGMV